jgi:hypothetical protein
MVAWFCSPSTQEAEVERLLYPRILGSIERTHGKKKRKKNRKQNFILTYFPNVL